MALASPPPDGPLWRSVDALVGRASRLSDIRAHRLELFAARRWRRLGQPVPPEIEQEERLAAVASLTAAPLLERVRASLDGDLLLMKGPEVAACYPDPILRPFKDLDLLVRDAEAAQKALLAAGFQPVGDPALYVGIHHLRPLCWPGLPLAVELHSRPKWIDGLEPPSPEELFADVVDSVAGVAGVSAFPPDRHALVLAAHSWAHEPLRRLRDLVDVAAVADGLDRRELERVARAWRMERAWRSTIRTADGLFLHETTPLAARLWARNLTKVRERTVLENHLQRWLSSFWALPPGAATRTLGSTFAREVMPGPGESWGHKLGRAGRAFRHAVTRRSEHDRSLRRRRPG